MDILLSQTEVCDAVKLCRAQIWRLEKENKFPKRVTQGRRIAWRKSEVQKYIENLS